jgi:hypothetical protein
MSRVDNNALGGVPPKIYRAKMPNDISEIMDSHLLPPDMFFDDYEKFAIERMRLLEAEADKLMA